MFLEDDLDRLQIEFGSQVHDRKIFFVEGLMLPDAVAVAFDEVVEEIDVRVHVAVEVHRHEPGQLHEAGIDRTHEAGVRKRHGRNDVTFEPAEGLSVREIVDLGRIAPGIDRAAHQYKRGGLGRSSLRAAIRAAATSAGTAGWQTAMTCVFGPMKRMKSTT